MSIEDVKERALRVLEKYPEIVRRHVQDRRWEVVQQETTYYSKGEHCGVFVQVDMSRMQTRILEDLHKVGVKILPLREALELEVNTVKRLYWKLVDIEESPYAALVAAYGQDMGCFLHVPEGVRLTMPLYTCFLTTRSNYTQLVHNVIVIEDNSEVCLISGCLTTPRTLNISHVSVTEIYVGKNSTLYYAMLHSWNDTVEVHGLTVVKLGENAKFVSMYFTQSPVKITDLTTRVIQDAGSEHISTTIVVGRQKGHYRNRTESILSGENAKTFLVSRLVAFDQAEIMTHSKIVACGCKTRGHIECLGLALTNSSKIVSIPELEARVSDTQLTHEAAIGKLSEEELAYLMSRGLTEDEAKMLYVSGFVNVDVPHLPDRFRQVIDRISRELAKRGGM